MMVGDNKVATNNNTNSVNVVVNSDKNVMYPAPILPRDAMVNLPKDMQPNKQPDKQPNIQPNTHQDTQLNISTPNFYRNEIEFYKTLSSILSSILKDNNPKLIANLIDNSGKVILTGNQLVKIISLKIMKDPSEVNIQYKDEEPGCMAKVKFIKDIINIKINNESFSLKYNAEYNILKDDYNISLDRVIIF